MEKDFEKIIEEAIGMKESGKSLPEILHSFPEQEKELSEVFSLVVRLREKGDHVAPKKEMLHTILQSVPALKEVQPIKQDSESKFVLASFFSFNSPLRVLLPSMAVVVLVVAGAYFYMNNLGVSPEYAVKTDTPEDVSRMPPSQSNLDTSERTTSMMSLKSADPLDAQIDEIVFSTTNEGVILDEMNGDTDFIFSDSQAVTGLSEFDYE